MVPETLPTQMKHLVTGMFVMLPTVGHPHILRHFVLGVADL